VCRSPLARRWTAHPDSRKASQMARQREDRGGRHTSFHSTGEAPLLPMPSPPSRPSSARPASARPTAASGRTRVGSKETSPTLHARPACSAATSHLENDGVYLASSPDPTTTLPPDATLRRSPAGATGSQDSDESGAMSERLTRCRLLVDGSLLSSLGQVPHACAAPHTAKSYSLWIGQASVCSPWCLPPPPHPPARRAVKLHTVGDSSLSGLSRGWDAAYMAQMDDAFEAMGLGRRPSSEPVTAAPPPARPAATAAAAARAPARTRVPLADRALARPAGARPFYSASAVHLLLVNPLARCVSSPPLTCIPPHLRARRILLSRRRVSGAGVCLLMLAAVCACLMRVVLGSPRKT